MRRRLLFRRLSIQLSLGRLLSSRADLCFTGRQNPKPVTSLVNGVDLCRDRRGERLTAPGGTKHFLGKLYRILSTDPLEEADFRGANDLSLLVLQGRHAY